MLRCVVLLALLGANAPGAEPKTSTLPAGAVARLADDRLRHAEPVTALVFLPDGRLVSGSRDGTVRVWDMATGLASREIANAGSPVVQIMLTDRGKMLAVSFGGDNIHLHDSGTCQPSGTLKTASHEQFAITPDGRYIARLASDGAVSLVERSTDLPALELPAATRIAFHPQGHTITLSGTDGGITSYRIVGGQPSVKLRHEAEVGELHYRSDGARLVSVGFGDAAVVKVWEPGQEKPLDVIEAKAPAAFLGEDRLVLRRKDSVGIYDLAKKAWVREIPTPAEVIAVSPDGTRLATAGSGTRIQLWDLATGRPLLAPQAFPANVSLLAPAADGKSVLAFGDGGVIRWRFDESTAQCVPLPGGPIAAAAANRDRLAVAIAGEVRLYENFDPDRPIPDRPARMVPLAIDGRGLAVSPDGRLVAFGGANRQVRILDVKDNAGPGTLPTDTLPIALTFHPRVPRLVMLGRDGFLRSFDVAPIDDAREPTPGQELWKLRVQRGQRGAVAYSHDGQWIAASSSTRLSMVHAGNGSEVFAFDRNIHDGQFLDLAFSPDGRYLATASDGSHGAVQVWEVATRSRIRRFTTNLGAATRVAFLPDGRRLISAGADDSLTVWDIAPRTQPPGDADLREAAGRLASLDSPSAADAVWTLIAAGKRSLPLLDEAARKTKQVNERVASLIKQLEADDYAERDAASRDLLALGHASLKAVETACDSPQSETRQRATAIRSKMANQGIVLPSHGLIAGELQKARISHVRERIQANPERQ